MGHRQLYVADLDAIAGGEPAWSVHWQLLTAGLEMWLDAGIASAERAVAIAELSAGGNSVHRVIAGLESLPDIAALASMFASIGRERFVFSLDLRAGRLLTGGPAFPRDPLAMVDEVMAIGVERLIVLDLASVGGGQGPTVVDLCRQIRRRAPQVEMIAGGGVRGTGDLARLRDAGCDAALVASWLHASWASFARTGDPGAAWQRWDPSTRPTMVISGARQEVELDPAGHELALWL